MTMTTMTEIKPAISRSISHNEIVLVRVEIPRAAIEAIDNDENVTDLDWTESEIGIGRVLDVWGTRLGKEFRLHIMEQE